MRHNHGNPKRKRDHRNAERRRKQMAADARRLDKERRGRGKKRGGRRKEELQKEAPYHHELIWHYKEGHIPICSHTLYCITYMKQDIAQSPISLLSHPKSNSFSIVFKPDF